MTAPNQSSPDGSLGVGQFAAWQAMTEEDAKQKMKIPLNAWDGAQGNLKDGFAPREYVHREVVRLDNRIDELVTSDGRAQIATYSIDDVWVKPPGAYRIVVDVMGGSSGGGRSNNGGSGGSDRAGTGGFSGGWTKKEFDAGVIPDTVPVIVGPGGGGGTSDGSFGAAGTGSMFGGLAEAGGATSGAYGEGNWTFRIRGGRGAQGRPFEPAGQTGGTGSFDPGGNGGISPGGRGENGFSVGAAKIGMGSGGGGGGSGGGLGGNGGRGGDGGWPSGPGGGGGQYLAFGFAGNGGIGAGGAVYVTSYIRDTAGNPPTQPTNVTATAITQSTATITWTASTDDVRVEKYVVILGTVEIGETSGTFFGLSQLSGSTQYTVQIVAVDLAGNKSQAGTVTFTTAT